MSVMCARGTVVLLEQLRDLDGRREKEGERD